jgi:hypothetical protein
MVMDITTAIEELMPRGRTSEISIVETIANTLGASALAQATDLEVQPEIDLDVLQELLNMGFAERPARKALLFGAWLTDHADDGDINSHADDGDIDNPISELESAKVWLTDHTRMILTLTARSRNGGIGSSQLAMVAR